MARALLLAALMTLPVYAQAQSNYTHGGLYIIRPPSISTGITRTAPTPRRRL